MQIDVNWDSSVASAPTGFKAAIDYVVGIYDSLFTNNLTLTINVGWGEVDGSALGASDLGESEFFLTSTNYSQIRSALIAGATSSTQKTADASLPATDPTAGASFLVTVAEAQSLGIGSAGVAGWVGFSSGASWDFSPDTTPSGGEFDFIGVAEHEISEVMGRISFPLNDPSQMDLFRYSASGVRDLTPSPPSGYSVAYFSIDGGATDLDNWNPVAANGDLGDWASSVTDDAYLAASGPDHQNYLTTTDVSLMDVIGWDSSSAPNQVANGVTALAQTFSSAEVVLPGGASVNGVIGAKGSLNLAAGATATNTLVQSGGTLALTGGAATANTIAAGGRVTGDGGSLEGSTTNAGLIDVDGAGGLLVQSGTLENAGRILVSGSGALGVAGGTLDDKAGSTLTLEGGGVGLDVAAGANVTIDSGATTTWAGTIANDGEISIAGSGPAANVFVAASGVSLSGIGDVALGGSAARIGASSSATLTNSETISGAGHVGNGMLAVVNAAEGLLDADGSGSLVVGAPGNTFANSGVVEASGAGALIVEGAALVNSGTVDSSTGGRVVLETPEVVGGVLMTDASSWIELKGSVALEGGVSEVSIDGRLLANNGASLGLAGSIANAGEIVVSSLNHAMTTTIAGATILSGGGKIELTGSASNRITAFAAATLTNVDNRISGEGVIGGADLALTNDGGGMIVSSGAQELTLSTGSNVIVNAGVLRGGAGGGMVIASAVDNTGRLEAAGGSLTLEDAVTGKGVASINGGVLSFDAAFSENVSFGATGTLVLADSQSFAGKIANFSKTGSTKLDLEDIGFTSGVTSAAYNSATGALNVTDGVRSARILLTGDFSGSTWSLSSDGHGGTLVVDPASDRASGQSPSTQEFVAAMSALPPTPGRSDVETAWRQAAQPTLMTPGRAVTA